MRRGIIFDFDGVICNSVNVKTLAFASMYKAYGKEVVSKVVDYHQKHGGISRYEKFRYYHKELLGITLTEEQVVMMGDMFSSIVLQKVIDSPYLPGVLNFIQASRRVADLFICTGTPEAEIRIILEKRGLTKFFKGIYGAPKSKTEIIREIMTTNQISAEQLEFYGDAMTDYNAAKDTGIKFTGVHSATTSFPEGTFVIMDFKEVNVNESYRL